MSGIQLSVELFSTPETVYDAFMDGVKQASITGAPAIVQNHVGGTLSLYSGAVTGQFVHLRRPSLIVLTWATHDFEPHEAPSRLEIRLAPTAAGCRLQITQDRVPKRLRTQMINGWTSAYFPDLKAWTAPN